MVIWENSLCSILFYLLVPGGRWQTVIRRPVSAANFANSIFQAPDPGSVGTTAVGADQQPVSVGMAVLADGVPRLYDAHGDRRRRSAFSKALPLMIFAIVDCLTYLAERAGTHQKL